MTIEAPMPAALPYLAALALLATIVAMVTIGVTGTVAILTATVLIGWLTPSRLRHPKRRRP
jgi:hypothetical protein